MVKLHSRIKVIIIGTGVSGLALAQILRNEKIEFEIFERDGGDRAQGWGIGLDECLEPFYKLLPSDLNDLSSASPNFGLQKTDNFTVVDGLSHKVLGTTSAKFVGEARLSIFVSRNKFRQLLSRNLKINYGKQFLSYEEDHEGVTALFGDGTVARGDILLGADGSNSSVRSQLLRGFQASPSAFLMFHGDVVLSKLQYEPLLEHSSCGILTGGSRVKIYLLLMEFLENETALFNWNVSWQSNDLEADQAWAQAASQESLLEKSVKIIQGYPPYVVQAIEQTKSQNVQKPPIKLIETLLPPHGLPKGRVSLLGDAAHSMVPFRGMGANTAILDACDLGQSLIQGIKAGEDLQWILQAYEEKMIPRGIEKVLASRATGESADSAEVAGGRLQEE